MSDTTRNSAGFAATASTLMALVAMATAVSGGSPVRVEDAAVRAETPVSRVVAAVVVAVARDLARAEHSSPAALLVPESRLDSGPAVDRPRGPIVIACGAALDERLLDLPPPAA